MKEMNPHPCADRSEPCYEWPESVCLGCPRYPGTLAARLAPPRRDRVERFVDRLEHFVTYHAVTFLQRRPPHPHPLYCLPNWGAPEIIRRWHVAYSKQRHPDPARHYRPPSTGVR